MGLCCMTELNDEYINFIPDHPFININEHNLYEKIKKLINHPQNIIDYKKSGRKWVVKNHDLNNTAEILYQYYNDNNWI